MGDRLGLADRPVEDHTVVGILRRQFQQADRLDDIGEELKKAAATLGPKYGLKPPKAG
jgi:hypothetical protein